MSEWQVSLIFQDSKSNKFWRARCLGNNLEVNFGRIGSQGQTQAKRYDSPEDAAAELQKQAREKSRKGYIAGDGGPSEAARGVLDRLGNGGIALKAAVKLLDSGSTQDAIAAARSIPDRVDSRVANWIIATSGRPDVPSALIAETIRDAKDWPGQTLLRIRYEQALRNEQAPPDQVIAALKGSAPVSDEGALLLARAYAAVGRREEIGKFLRPFWRDQDIGEDNQAAIAKEFGDTLGAADAKARMDRLLYAGKADDGLRASRLLDKPQQQLAEARAAVIKRAANASRLLDDVPAAEKKDPGHLFARIQLLRRAGKLTEAAQLMLTAPTDPKVLVNPDAWSEERREIARRLIDAGGDAKLAYRVMEHAAATSRTPRVEAEFEAGWYAFRLVNDKKAAARHFKEILANSTSAVSQARGNYWLGRVAESEGNAAEANDYFKKASAYPTAFYGQMAALKLKRTDLGLGRLPSVDEATARRFGDRELVQVIARLHGVGRNDETAIFYRQLAGTLTDPGELTLLGALADSRKQYKVALQVGQIAQGRIADVGTLAFPTAGLPAYGGPAKIDAPVLYAVARQESAFDQSTVSSAGAVGLMQIMPQFAKEMADKVGLPFAKERLYTDPAYNVQIGAAELAALAADYNGSYLLTFAAYNAGPGRLGEWIKTYGDPRDPKIDAADWIERIPFAETRNYVQRVLENLTVYRARIGSPTLRFHTDLYGTRPQG